MRYELWDVDSGNQVEICQTQQDAIDAVRELLALNGEDSIRSMMLGVIRREPSGKVRMFPLLDGDELLQQAQETQTAVRSS
ncbi:MAG TPA: hypothetical protein VFH48_08815 [Chloroflexota bacterium]|nr:hypothetical protein [Chloroflexota bacterium]